MSRRLLVTSALPYANGPIHIGHLVEYIQTDVWVRAMRQFGHDVIYLCADDAHGAPIMLRAESEGITPEALVERIGAEHRADFADFGVGFDNYYSTHSDENRQLAEDIFTRLSDAGHIVRYGVTRLFDPVKGMFLADRFIRGECPRCGAADQYGDSCEACGATYAPTELKNPRSALSGAEPVLRESEHYFFRLRDFADLLQGWTRAGHLQEEVANKIAEWFESGLADWDISRDAPYFGFEIPDAPGKYFYVWLDAPVGYLASLKNYCDKSGRSYDALMADPALEQIHFIGKDITYFHTLFWPAVLHGAGNGILTIAKGTLPLALFGQQGYGKRQGWLVMPSRVAQAAAPFVFGLALQHFGEGALWLSFTLGLSAFVCLMLLRSPAAKPIVR